MPNVEEYITELKENIANYGSAIIKYKKEIETLEKIRLIYPDVQIGKGNVFISNSIWDKVSCMRIAYGDHYNDQSLIVKFCLPNKYMIDGKQIYTNPYINKITKTERNYHTKVSTIKIFDYKSIIPDECPGKNKFISRMKKAIITGIVKNKMIIDPTSFDIDSISKLTMLI